MVEQEQQIEDVLVATQLWLEKAVIGLNLCPFAKAVYVKQQVHCVVSAAANEAELFSELKVELEALLSMDSQVRDTTLLIIPNRFGDFLDFNDFIGEADALLEDMDLEGELQIASFHPQFQFAGTDVDDVSNYTNRAPYPIVHVLREASIDRAVASFPDASVIYERNIETLEALGVVGWQGLFKV
ncbi:hypothetical protein DTO96_100534 [Ephemeroptericola cinctiostellae]|uniref:Peptidase n=1 Tax=Ephemeroptericola cinctiostellae TaxID=2268024 RepID=A0A345D8Y6_9BURK|nr:DUF1415 domain-containing protein [Ephemeroptericola cinctiostellae]AXF84824.1 hypothetical protein DTO96_100534 [Ephemeroptericola cinctiostellae]